MARYQPSFLYGDPNAPDDGRDQLLGLLDGGGVERPPSAPSERDRATAPSLQEKDASSAGAPGAFRGFGLRDDSDQLVATMLGDRPGSGPRASTAFSETAPVNTHVDQGGPASTFRGGGDKSDPQLEAAWRDAQLKALQQADFAPGKYGFGEFARDNGGALLASILDIGFNKGRGLGGIVGATAQEVGKQQEARQKRAEAAGKFAIEARGKPQDPILLELQQQRIDNARQAELGRGNRFDLHRGDVNDPNSQRNATAVQQAFERSRASGQGSQEAQHEYNPTIAQDQANIAGARSVAETSGRTETELGYAPQTNAAAAQRAAEVAQAQTPAYLDKEQQMNKILADRSNNGVGAGLSAEGIAAANPNLRVSNPELLQQALKTRMVNVKTLDDIKAANRGAEIVDRLYDTARQMHELPQSGLSIGEMNAKRAELERTFGGGAEEYAGVISRISGAAGQNAKKDAMDLIPSIYNPYALEGIKGLWSPLEANINGNLGAIGISANRPRALGGTGREQTAQTAPQQQATIPGPSAPGAGMPNYGHDLSETGLGAPTRVPRVAAQTPTGGMHHIRNLKTGRVVPTAMSPQQLQPALSNGWELVD